MEENKKNSKLTQLALAILSNYIVPQIENKRKINTRYECCGIAKWKVYVI